MLEYCVRNMTLLDQTTVHLRNQHVYNHCSLLQEILGSFDHLVSGFLASFLELKQMLELGPLKLDGTSLSLSLSLQEI